MAFPLYTLHRDLGLRSVWKPLRERGPKAWGLSSLGGEESPGGSTAHLRAEWGSGWTAPSLGYLKKVKSEGCQRVFRQTQQGMAGPWAELSPAGGWIWCAQQRRRLANLRCQVRKQDCKQLSFDKDNIRQGLQKDVSVHLTQYRESHLLGRVQGQWATVLLSAALSSGPHLSSAVTYLRGIFSPLSSPPPPPIFSVSLLCSRKGEDDWPENH